VHRDLESDTTLPVDHPTEPLAAGGRIVDVVKLPVKLPVNLPEAKNIAGLPEPHISISSPPSAPAAMTSAIARRSRLSEG
jgi:hypothetical protein